MQTIGERLEEARKRKGISIREAAESTKIRSDYLHKFESNQFDIRLPDIYLRGFLRNYANFLKLPGDRIVADFQALGFGEVKSAKALSREVYGRMEISASSKTSAEDTAPAGSTEAPQAATATSEPPPARRAGGTHPPTAIAGRLSSIGSSIAGLNLNRSLLIKTGVLVAGGILLLILVVWGSVALFRSKKDPSPGTSASASSTTSTPSSSDASFVIINRPANLKVTRVSDGRVIYQSNAPLTVGTRVPVPLQLVTITTDAAENVAIEYRGRAFSHGQTGRREFPINLETLRQ